MPNGSCSGWKDCGHRSTWRRCGSCSAPTFFWSWALIETIRPTGCRIEEVLEQTQFSLWHYAPPSPGTVVPAPARNAIQSRHRTADSDDTGPRRGPACRGRRARSESLRLDQAVGTRTWSFRRAHTGDNPGWLLNGRAFDPSRIDAGVWLAKSRSGGSPRICTTPCICTSTRSGARPPRQRPRPARRWLEGHRGPLAQRVGRRRRAVTDYPGRYLLHCHKLGHEDMAMMATFRIS
ncbi:multicopper oxidase domain-containing protein [Asanoa ishikariensis]|uniref:multicopper oxidase domain-containing protein n=1 Tax=Asanoa ishikariensis TaxID=137265 RepID=UPI00268B1568